MEHPRHFWTRSRLCDVAALQHPETAADYESRLKLYLDRLASGGPIRGKQNKPPARSKNLSMKMGLRIFTVWTELPPGRAELYALKPASVFRLIDGRYEKFGVQNCPVWFLYLLDGVASGVLPPWPPAKIRDTPWRTWIKGLGLSIGEVAAVMELDPTTLWRWDECNSAIVGCALLHVSGFEKQPIFAEWASPRSVVR